MRLPRLGCPVGNQIDAAIPKYVGVPSWLELRLRSAVGKREVERRRRATKQQRERFIAPLNKKSFLGLVTLHKVY